MAFRDPIQERSVVIPQQAPSALCADQRGPGFLKHQNPYDNQHVSEILKTHPALDGNWRGPRIPRQHQASWGD